LKPGRWTGFPTSSNRASSFHLIWLPSEELVEASVVLEILVPPSVPHLYFWALQASFTSAGGVTGSAHLGLQWYAANPGWPAANWGGYGPEGRLLEGTVSPLPSASGDANTRSFPWRPDNPYRLRIFPGERGWGGEITDLLSGKATVVRHLYGGGDRLSQLMIWSEVFARCDDPPVSGRWSEPAGTTRAGMDYRAAAYRVNYQAHEAGGCANTEVRLSAHGVEQLTSTRRSIGPNSVISTGQDLAQPSR
jgi:hypothetical protein